MKKRKFQIANLDFYGYAFNGQYVIAAKRYENYCIIGTVSKMNGKYYYTFLGNLNAAFCEQNVSFDDSVIYSIDNAKTKPIFFEDRLLARKALIEKITEIIDKSQIK